MNTEQQNNEFTNEQREEILQKEFNFGLREGLILSLNRPQCKKTKLIDIIEWIIDDVKTLHNYGKVLDCIRKYWFTKQIEEWKKKKKKKNKADKEPNNDKLMDIVKEDLKIRIANTMLALEQELKQHNDINQGDIWFHFENNCVSLYHHGDPICEVSEFNHYNQHMSTPYKPFFMKNPNDNNKLNGVCIYKHGNDENEDGKSKTKWIMACFKNNRTKPQCKITFKTDENNKITNVEIENKKDRNSGKSTYTISLDTSGVVERITKEGEGDTNKNYTKEIQQLLFEDKTNKVLIDSIEDELDNQQKVVFEEIKKYLCIEKDTKKEKEEENKEEEEEKEENNASCNCCGLDLSCFKSCTKESFVEK